MKGWIPAVIPGFQRFKRIAGNSQADGPPFDLEGWIVDFQPSPTESGHCRAIFVTKDGAVMDPSVTSVSVKL